MKSLSLAHAALLGGIAAGVPAVASAEDPAEEATLSAKEVAKYFAPYVAEVRDCYVTNARSKTAEGTLRLELIIHPGGKIYRFGYAAPGVVKPWSTRLDKCLRKLPSTWSFPVRRSYTSAVLPFLFQRTNAPGAGPIESCWDPKGCPGKAGGK